MFSNLDPSLNLKTILYFLFSSLTTPMFTQQFIFIYHSKYNNDKTSFNRYRIYLHLYWFRTYLTCYPWRTRKHLLLLLTKTYQRQPFKLNRTIYQCMLWKLWTTYILRKTNFTHLKVNKLNFTWIVPHWISIYYFLHLYQIFVFLSTFISSIILVQFRLNVTLIVRHYSKRSYLQST